VFFRHKAGHRGACACADRAIPGPERFDCRVAESFELLESETGTFFNSGSPNPTDKGTELLPTLATELGKLPNKISIEGHTDSKPYAGARDYGNWELSADRANAARRLMQRDGLGPNQVSQVRGFADQEQRKKEEPLDPSNRRITLIVQFIVRDADEDSLKRAAPPGGAKPAIGKSEEKGQ
jgi:chemotaxis protein MotB